MVPGCSVPCGVISFLVLLISFLVLVLSFLVLVISFLVLFVVDNLLVLNGSCLTRLQTVCGFLHRFLP